MPAKPIVGLHHVTAIASDPQANLDFYTEVLGLRFVKKTVNFDDPGTYHFYFGDDVGSPGTILTFFPWPRAGRGHAGAGEVTHTAFSIPLASVDYWEQRLRERGEMVERSERFAEVVLTLADPDGMKLELVGHKDVGPVAVPRFAGVPAEHAIRGFFGVTMLEIEAEETTKTLNLMGFEKVAEEGQRLRFASAAGAAQGVLGNHIDVVVDRTANFGRSGAGSVHHIAFRAANDASQLEWRAEIGKHIGATPVLDRDYFHSIYFREPGGVLFELATDNPGFAVDEPVETLGERLCLPAWLEPRREELEKRLIPLELKKAAVVA
jgi:glyoxalase family protein